MNRYEFKVQWCPVCDQGWVEIVKAINNHDLFLRCSECMTQWDGVKELKSGEFKEEEVAVTKPEYKDIINSGWDKYILTE